MNRNQFINEYGELSNEILLNIAEVLTLRLPEGNERIIASKWVKKFNSCDPNSYKQYLSLFVSCLTKQLLVDPFDKPPKDTTNQWNDFDREYTQKNINDGVIHRLYMDSFTPPYQLDISNDMKEYVAFQEIPFFGAHLYYAFSPRDRIDKWSKFNKLNVPKNLVEEMRKDDLVQSPIKGRLFPRPKFSKPATSNVTFRPKPKKLEKPKKPEWEDLIPQEEPEPEPERKPTIIIPTDVPVKNIPAALQRRMAKAEQERQERIAKKAKESKNLQQKLAAMKKLPPRRSAISIKPPASQKKPAKKIKGIAVDSIDAELMKQKPAASLKKPAKKIKGIAVDDIDAALMSQKPPEIPTQPKSPEFKGPHADLQRRLFHLRQSNLPPELFKTAHDINQTSANLNKEAQRLKRDGTANLRKVEKLHNVSLSVGQRILNMLKEHQAEELKEAAENAAVVLENVRLTMDELDEMLELGAQTHKVTINKLNEIKERMQKTAYEAQNVSIKMNAKKMGRDVIDVMDGIVNVSANSANLLQNIPVETQQEGNLIEGLEHNSQELADIIQAQRDRLSKALENNEPNLLPILDQTVKNIDEILSCSLHENAQLVENTECSSNAVAAIEIETQKNEELNDMKERALKILHDVESAIYKIMNVSDELIDIDNEDLGFDDVVDENEMEKHRQLKMMERQERLEEIQQRAQLANISDSENLEDISAVLMEEIESSITEIDQILIPGLQKLEVNDKDPKNREIIHDAIDALERNVEVLHESLLEITNLKEALKSDDEYPIDYDLMTFPEDDLIRFD